MRPFLFHIGAMGVPSMFFMIMLGSLCATFYAAHVAKKENADQIVLLDFGIIGVIASVIGARLFSIIVEHPGYYLEDPIRVFYFWQGGFVSIGAFLASVISWLVYMKARKLDRWRYLDIVVTSAPIIIFFVRMGCLLVGCCYGKPTNFFLHLIFHDQNSTAGYLHRDISLHATQPYFMANAVVMWFVLRYAYARRKFYGQVLCMFMLYYGVTRFFIEFLRGDADRGMWFGQSLSTGQISMILTFTGGIVLWKYLKKTSPSPFNGRGSGRG